MTRPVRGVVLIRNNDPEWQDTVLRTIEWLSRCWGGCYWLILPTDGETIDQEFWWLLEKYDPDYLYLYKKTLGDLKLSKPQEYSKLLEEQVRSFCDRNPGSDPASFRKQIDDDAGKIPIGSSTLSTALQAELKNRLNPFYKNNVVEGSIGLRNEPAYPITHIKTAVKSTGVRLTNFFTPNIEGSKSIQLLFYSMLGKADRSLVEELDKEQLLGLFRGEAPYPENKLQELARETWQQTGYAKSMPFAATMTGLTFYFSSEYQRGPVVIVGDTPKDFLLYYNLSRLRTNVYWLPMSLIVAFSEETKSGKTVEGEAAYLTWLVGQLERDLQDIEDEKVLLYSHSLKPEDLDQIKRMATTASPVILEEEENIATKFVIKSYLQDLLPYMRRLYTQEGIERAYIEQFYEGESINFLNTPIPRFPNMPPCGHYWITEVKVQNYRPPVMEGIGARSILYPRATQKENWLARASAEGMAYFCPDVAYFEGWGGIEKVVVRPKIKLLDDFAIAEEVLKKGGYSIRYSDKGNYHRESALKFGGFDHLSHFLTDEKRRNLFTRFLDNKRENKDKETLEVFLDIPHRSYLSFKGITAVLGAEETTDILDQLLEKEVLHRGLIFQCQYCRNAAWYPIQDVTTTFTCARCRRSQTYKKAHWKDPAEPQWYYELAEVVYQGLRHNMHVPILALKYLKKEAKEAFHYVPEIGLYQKSESGKPDMELDFVAVVDANIFLGEATTSDKLSDHAGEEEKELKRLKHLAQSVHAKEVVLATFSDNWSERTKSKTKEVFDKSTPSVRFFVRDNLVKNS